MKLNNLLSLHAYTARTWTTTFTKAVDSRWNVMAHGDAREGKWRGNWRMECVASTLHATSEHGLSSITTADAHTSAASSRLNWRPRRFKWTRAFRRKAKSGFCACAITFQTQSIWAQAVYLIPGLGWVEVPWYWGSWRSYCTGAGWQMNGNSALVEWRLAGVNRNTRKTILSQCNFVAFHRESPNFDPSVIHVGYAVDKVVLGQFSLSEYFRYPLSTVALLMLRIHVHSSKSTL